MSVYLGLIIFLVLMKLSSLSNYPGSNPWLLEPASTLALKGQMSSVKLLLTFSRL
jgi:hypothetical protein